MRRLTLTFAAVLAVAGCGSADRDRVLDAYEATCAAQRLAAGGDAARAETGFLDDAHEGLHVLADRLLAVDRSVAADLLEAKQRVEADLTNPGTGDLARDLAELADQTRRALDRLGVETPPECA